MERYIPSNCCRSGIESLHVPQCGVQNTSKTSFDCSVSCLAQTPSSPVRPSAEHGRRQALPVRGSDYAAQRWCCLPTRCSHGMGRAECIGHEAGVCARPEASACERCIWGAHVHEAAERRVYARTCVGARAWGVRRQGLGATPLPSGDTRARSDRANLDSARAFRSHTMASAIPLRAASPPHPSLPPPLPPPPRLHLRSRSRRWPQPAPVAY